MAYKVRISDSAKAKLDEIVAYFVNTLRSPKAAVSLLEDFIGDYVSVRRFSPDSNIKSIRKLNLRLHNYTTI